MEWFDPGYFFEVGGIILFLFIVYAESGLLIGIVLPGDSILLTAGFLHGTNHLSLNLYLLLALTVIAAFLGYCTGYGIGYYFRGIISKKEDSLFFKKKYILRTKAVFRKYHWKTYLIGRFLPIVRTFIPLVAGMVHINFRKFLWLNFISSLVWTIALVLFGFYVGKLFPSSLANLEWILTFIIILISIPFVSFLIKFFHKGKRHNARRLSRENSGMRRKFYELHPKVHVSSKQVSKKQN